MTYALQFREFLVPLGNPELAAPMTAYMKGKFAFLGIKSQPRKEAMRAFIKKQGLPPAEEVDASIREFWQMPEREFHYCSMEMLERLHRKPPPEALDLYLYMTVHQAWWDTVDMISQKLIGRFFDRYPEEEKYHARAWYEDENIWLKRTAILYQNRRKERTDWPFLQECIEACMYHSDFFIRKGIGWALREYAKTAPEAVLDFVNTHPELSPLSKKEALKHLKS